MNFYSTEYDFDYDRASAEDEAWAYFLDMYPGQPWLDPEDRDLVSYDDVKDPEGASFWRYGAGHAIIIPGCWD